MLLIFFLQLFSFSLALFQDFPPTIRGNIPLVDKLKELKESSIEIANNQDMIISNFHVFIDNIEKNTGYFFVKTISSILPHVDSIGHKILHADDVFITEVLNTDIIPHELKGKIVLFTIKMAQNGDEFGRYLLQLYYDIVERCMIIHHM
jgi:hypothetical protein